MAQPADYVTSVLRECEEALRLLAIQGRLASHSLATFMELSATIRREMERRKRDRREAPRSTPDRRASAVDATVPVAAAAVHRLGADTQTPAISE